MEALVVEPSDNKTPEALSADPPNDAPQEIPEHEIELQQEIVDVIGARLESDKKTAAAVHKDVVLRWSEIVKKGTRRRKSNHFWKSIRFRKIATL